jgi:hypothetical protein
MNWLDTQEVIYAPEYRLRRFKALSGRLGEQELCRMAKFDPIAVACAPNLTAAVVRALGARVEVEYRLVKLVWENGFQVLLGWVDKHEDIVPRIEKLVPGAVVTATDGRVTVEV